MFILGIIPARYASVRFPGKPLAAIAGKPMIQWVYENARTAFEHVVVATDDERIFKAVLSFGGQVVMTRADHVSGTDRCAEALDNWMLEKKVAETPEIVVNIQGDEPFVQKRQLEQLAGLFSSKDVDIATLIKKIDDNVEIYNVNVVKVVKDINGKALYFSRAPIPYLRGTEKHENWARHNVHFRHLGLYAYRSHVLKALTLLKPSSLEMAESLEQLRWIENGYNIYTGETDLHLPGIDTPEDLERAKKMLEDKLKNKENN